ncbi:hypothetical protein M2344_001832 [Sphingobium sp. B8D3C]|nr:hypothetical protein [Sphingobium sp. B8D3B]MCW2418870.1 hypothetical protein [Sphingobium sp. B8D3C]
MAPPFPALDSRFRGTTTYARWRNAAFPSPRAPTGAARQD